MLLFSLTACIGGGDDDDSCYVGLGRARDDVPPTLSFGKVVDGGR
jgi:hypothetical protein